MCAFVMVAEDDTKQAELVRRYLRREDHAVLVVEDDIVLALPLDLVLAQRMRLPTTDAAASPHLVRRETVPFSCIASIALMSSAMKTCMSCSAFARTTALSVRSRSTCTTSFLKRV